MNLSSGALLQREHPSTAACSHVSPDRAFQAARKLLQMHVLQAPPSPVLPAPEVCRPCQPLLCSSSYSVCTQIGLFPRGRNSFCAGTAPEGKTEGDYQSREKLKHAKLIRKWVLHMFPLGGVQMVSSPRLSGVGGFAVLGRLHRR